MPRKPSIRLRLDQPFREALRDLAFFYISNDRLRPDEAGMYLTAFEDYIRKWDNITKKLARGITFRSYSPQGIAQGPVMEPDDIIERHRQGCRVVMLGLEDRSDQEIRWSG
jgi:hypothetical protein